METQKLPQWNVVEELDVITSLSRWAGVIALSFHVTLVIGFVLGNSDTFKECCCGAYAIDLCFSERMLLPCCFFRAARHSCVLLRNCVSWLYIFSNSLSFSEKCPLVTTYRCRFLSWYACFYPVFLQNACHWSQCAETVSFSHKCRHGTSGNALCLAECVSKLLFLSGMTVNTVLF